MSYRTGIAALTAAFLLSGCANADIRLRSGSSSAAGAGTPPPGASHGTAVFRADVRPGGYFALLLFGHLMAGYEGDYRDGRDFLGGRSPPELAEDRTVVEMDCRLPMERPSGNLRCK